MDSLLENEDSTDDPVQYPLSSIKSRHDSLRNLKSEANSIQNFQFSVLGVTAAILAFLIGNTTASIDDILNSSYLILAMFVWTLSLGGIFVSGYSIRRRLHYISRKLEEYNKNHQDIIVEKVSDEKFATQYRVSDMRWQLFVCNAGILTSGVLFLVGILGLLTNPDPFFGVMFGIFLLGGMLFFISGTIVGFSHWAASKATEYVSEQLGEEGKVEIFKSE